MLLDSRQKVKRLFRIFSRSLLRTLVKEIGRKFIGFKYLISEEKFFVEKLV